ncbi:MAG: hypothetical protein RLZZ324_830 [Candidatus Parcubacteria bacterium]|jgi:hypothetical protein
MTQDLALAILKSGSSVFLTGAPGAGKTHTVNRYVAWLRAHSIEPALVASTGIAASHIGGMTVHSWAGIGILDSLSPYDLDRISNNEKVYRRIAKAKVLILDEVSMLAANTFSMVEAVCRAVRQNDEPFGGLQTVLVGDFFQLPPVSRPGSRAAYAYTSHAWMKLDPVICYIDEQHRQDDGELLRLLTAIRECKVDEEHHEVIRGRIAPGGAAPKGAVKLYSHNADVDRINEQHLATLPGIAKSYEMRSMGAPHLVETLKRGCLSPDLLKLKVGAAVMFTRNDQQQRFVNGTVGTVERFDAMGAPVVRTRAGALITVEPMSWSIDDQGKPLASLMQLPLRLAWAMTIHKSQGMSLDSALMDLGSTFEYGQGYVALSRVRSLEGLHLIGCNSRALEVHPEIASQDREFRTLSLAAEEAAGKMTLAEQEEAAMRFISACGGRIPKAGGDSVDDIAARMAAMKVPVMAHVVEPGTGTAAGRFAKARAENPRLGKRWTSEEELAVAQAFKDGTSVNDIAVKTGRMTGGIRSRLRKMGLME